MRAQGEGNCGRPPVQPWFGLLLRHEAAPVVLWVPGSGGDAVSPRREMFDPHLRSKGPLVKNWSCHPAPATQMLGSQNSIQTEMGLLTNHQPSTSPICGQSDDPARVAFISLRPLFPSSLCPCRAHAAPRFGWGCCWCLGFSAEAALPSQPGGPSSLSLVPDDSPCSLPAHCTSTHGSIAIADLFSYLGKRDFASLPCVSSE